MYDVSHKREKFIGWKFKFAEKILTNYKYYGTMESELISKSWFTPEKIYISFKIRSKQRILQGLTLFWVFASLVCGGRSQMAAPVCREDVALAWHAGARAHIVEWRIDRVCSTVRECTGENSSATLPVQLCPLVVQVGDRVWIRPPPLGSPYPVQLANVSYDNWLSCSEQPGPDSQVIVGNNKSELLAVPSRFLSPGDRFFSQLPDGTFSNCLFGLRLHIKIKDQDCRFDAELDQSCSQHGRCLTTFYDPGFECVCDFGYRGRYCEEYDACALLPCMLGGECQDVEEGLVGRNYQCNCSQGYTGEDCREVLGKCDVTFCENNSTCIQTSGATYTCECAVGYSGALCQVQTTHCSTGGACENNATCEDLPSGPRCHCQQGYTGVKCETDINECISAPCMEGAVCVDLVNQFDCLCLPHQDGATCNLTVAPCSPDPCEHASLCQPAYNGGYMCNCTFGYQGNRCQDNVQCGTGVCEHGGHCLSNFEGLVMCLCQPGWTGEDCSVLDNPCRTDPCPDNMTTCVDVSTVRQPGLYICDCVPGYTGSDCRTEITECDSDPCQNGATCWDKLNRYHCTCPEGYEGDHCQTNIDVCAGIGGTLCTSGATCIDGKVGYDYTCLCPPGITGIDCGVEVDECQSGPCQHGGNCTDLLDGYDCHCSTGWYGPHCQSDVDHCLNHECANGAECETVHEGYSCHCMQGWTGKFCDQDVEECSSAPCRNNATCHDELNAFRCECSSGYFGDFCDLDINECISDPCHGVATCQDRIDGYECVCPQGWQGMKCEINIDECHSAPCQHGGECEDLVNQYACNCTQLWTGIHCEEPLNNCSYTPCIHGNCFPDNSSLGYHCECQTRYTGTQCEAYIPACDSAPCENNATCREEHDLETYVCECVEGFGGRNCQTDINHCLQHKCSNNSICVDDITTYFCLCKPGYFGVLCEMEINECLSEPCLGGATCRDEVNGYSCICPPGFTGVDCEADIDECQSNPCQNGGTCNDLVGFYTCQCVKGYRGNHCELDVDLCVEGACPYSVNCTEVDNGTDVNCTCLPGYTGVYCDVEVDDCAADPCMNGGTCQDQVNFFSCICPTGLSGETCEMDIDECASSPCQHGATCIDILGGFVCNCSLGYTGDQCEYEFNECASSPCDHNNTLTCINLIGRYLCICKLGRTGSNCESDIDHCLEHQCLHNSTCVNNIDSYRCNCMTGYQGEFCEMDIDECDSSPCHQGICENLVGSYTCVCPDDKFTYDEHCSIVQPCDSSPCINNSTCINNSMEDNTFECECSPGFTGMYCEINKDDCENISCSEHGTCLDLINDFLCECLEGYTGIICETNIDDCSDNNCVNGVCVDGVNEYTCECSAGYYGVLCNKTLQTCDQEPCLNNGVCTPTPGSLINDILVYFSCECLDNYEGKYCEFEILPCNENPCLSGATCVRIRNQRECRCVPGFMGELCETDIDDCGDHQCMNGGQCEDGIDGYTCHCPAGLTGALCQYDILDCASDPCDNDAYCQEGANSYQCYCRNGFTGSQCQINYNECLSSPCHHGATCQDLVASYICHCPSGYTGTHCEIDINECEDAPCRNNGNCTDLVGKFKCECILGYTGDMCETEIDECDSSPCANGATCRDLVGQYRCDCLDPYVGMNCSLLPCDLNPCAAGGTCHNDLNDLPDGFRCDCLDGFTGKRCGINLDDCRPGACSGQGLCLDGINTYTCLCQPGWKGPDCLAPIDECVNNQCRNNATCVNQWLGYHCQCPLGYHGDYCERERDDCDSAPCRNGASCVDLVNDFKCLCAEGWHGKDCSEEIDECQTGSNPCATGATCVDSFNNFTCLCPPFRTGLLCDMTFDPCDLDNDPCHHGSNCSTNQDGSYKCSCTQGFAGMNCEIDLDECRSDPCQNEAGCEDLTDGYICHCVEGFTGKECETNIDDCIIQPCQNGASCLDGLNRYMCNCSSGYHGYNCSDDIDECGMSPCAEGSTCINTYGSFHCSCPPGYTGILCGEDVDECWSQPCQEDAVCVEGVDTFTCYCALGYTGALCQVNINDCLPHPCKHGQCEDLVEDYRCICDPGWDGVNCTDNINECLSSPCQQNGTCLDGDNGYVCQCPPGYTGVRCEVDLELCLDGMCLNGGTCLDGPGTYVVCQCAEGYEGVLCEINTDDCSSGPCLHGARCTDLVNGYSCHCTQGWTGTDCEADLDECESDPCQQGAICSQHQHTHGFQCLCPAGFGGSLCEIDYDDCLPGPKCYNGATCLDRLNSFICECPPGVTGDLCEVMSSVDSTEMPTYEVSTEIITMEMTEEMSIDLSTVLIDITKSQSTGHVTAEGVPDVRTTETVPEDQTEKLDILVSLTHEATTVKYTTHNIAETIADITTEPAEDITMETTADKSTDPISDITTESTADKFTEATEDITTDITAEKTTEATEDITTDITAEKTTEATEDITTKITAEKTTEATEDITTKITADKSTEATSDITRAIQTTEELLAQTSQPPNHTTVDDQLLATGSVDMVTTEQFDTATVVMTTTLEEDSINYDNTGTEMPEGSQSPVDTEAGLSDLRFEGESYIEFPSPTLKEENIIHLTLSTTQDSGVLLYSAQTYDENALTHYIRLYIQNGTLKYQFSCILQSFDLNSNVKVNTGANFKVTVRQTSDCKASLLVEGSTGEVGQSDLGAYFVFSRFSLTNLASIFVGGIPDNVTYIPEYFPGFVGCLGNLIINAEIFLIQDALSTNLVSGCYEETTSPFLVTTVTATAPPSPLYTTCTDNPCYHGATCHDLVSPAGGFMYQCECPLHYGGHQCQDDLVIYFPHFNGNSYLQHPSVDLDPDINDIMLTFKTNASVGTLIYSENEVGEFLHLYIENAELHYEASCGTNSLHQVATQVKVDTNNLTTATLSQDFSIPRSCSISIQVDDAKPVFSMVTTSQPPMEVQYGSLYIGGIPSHMAPHQRASEVLGFEGCVHNLQVNSRERLIYQDAESGDNIEECDIPACSYHPCRNNGICHIEGLSWFCECQTGYQGALCERHICDNNPCLHGATCIQVKGQGYVCLCPYGRHGVHCQDALVVTRPSFSGPMYSYSSFMSYPRIPGMDFQFELRFNFILHSPSSHQRALMIFTGQKASQPHHGADFFAVGLEDGHVSFKFDLGSGMASLSTSSPLDPNLNVHSVYISRVEQQAWLQVDRDTEVWGQTPGRLTGLNVFSDFYVGGYDDLLADSLPLALNLSSTFSGCLYDLEIRVGKSGKWSPLLDVKTGRNVGQCEHSECDALVSPCHNGGTCVDLGASFSCDCPDGWKGALCGDRETPCDITHDCTSGSLCVPELTGYKCHCPLGKAGPTCSQNITISDAWFTGESSYMAFRHPPNIRHQIDIQLSFRPLVASGLMLYVAEHLSIWASDFLSLTLHKGAVQLRFGLGDGGLTVLTSGGEVSDSGDAWHSVEAGRNTTHAYLRLDGVEVVQKTQQSLVGLDTATKLYVGGLPDLSALSPAAVQDDPVTFVGCIRRMVVNRHKYLLSQNGAVEGLNVEDCDGTGCGYDVCQHGGECFPSRTGSISCLCPAGYTGATCDTALICDHHNCAPGAICQPEEGLKTYRCLCPLGMQGEFCNEEIALSSDIGFHGDGYIIYRDPYYENSDLGKTYLSFNFSTSEEEGMILWNGLSYTELDDHLGIGVVRGRLEVTINLGWWTRQTLTPETYISDGKWHSFIIVREGHDVSVYLDNQVFATSLQGGHYGLNTDAIYHLGGFPLGKDIFVETNGHYNRSYTGCLKDICFHSNSQPISFNQSQEGFNILKCNAN